PPPAPPLIYDVTWDAPLHTVGQVTAVGGPYAPTTINAGTPMVREQLGTMAGPALEFKGAAYQQIQFKANRYARAYRLEFDAYLDLPVDFLVYFDPFGPVQSISFKANGTISLFQPGVELTPSLGSYPQRQTMQVAIDVDMVEKSWSIFINGVRRHLGPFNTSNDDLSTIRFHESGSSTGFAGLDNVRISAFAPGSLVIPGPRIAISPQRLDFPQVTVGKGKSWLLNVSNDGRQNLNVLNVVSSSGEFLVNWASPVTLLPGGGVAVPVEFRPQQIGPISGYLTIASDDPEWPSVLIPLTGIGAGIPNLTLTPPALDATMIAGTSGHQTFTLGNTGDGDLTWDLFLKQTADPGVPAGPGVTPNDPLFSSLWAMRSPTPVSGGIDAPRAWEMQTGINSVVVAVIDSGVDRSHPDLQGNLWVNPGEVAGNGIDDDLNGYVDDVHGWDFHGKDNNPSDVYGHGTHVAGTIAARGDNALGVTGVCWNARILPVKFLSDTGSGYTSDAISAVTYAARMGAKVMNNSWGGGGYSQALSDAIQAAGQAGSLFVASAGNDGANNDALLRYPSCYDLPNIVSVGSTDSSDALATSSNYGESTVDVAAPGAAILSLRPGGEYRTMSGTSMAAPHVSGVAALMLSENATLSPSGLRQLLMLGSDTLPALGNRVASGGRLNAWRSLKLVVPDFLRPSVFSGHVATGASQELMLAIDTESLEPGSYPLALSIGSNDPAHPVVDVPLQLKVVSGDGYARWAAGHFARHGLLFNTEENLRWSDAADPEGDGMNNLLEFITGGSPSISDASEAVTMRSGAGGPIFEFRVRDELDGASYRLEWTRDLAAPVWRSDGVITVDDTTAGQPEGTRRVRVKLTEPGIPSAFFRLSGRRGP
ncbi:MAG TPA: S8 family serine peptidase, partial [Haloferula sp.]